MKIGAMFPSNYLKAVDVEGDVVLTIKDVQMQEFKARDGSVDVKPIVSFEGETRLLVLNKTNSKLIARALDSDDSDDWIGKPVTLYATEVEFGSDIVDAIRIRGKKVANPNDLGDDEQIPF